MPHVATAPQVTTAHKIGPFLIHRHSSTTERLGTEVSNNFKADLGFFATPCKPFGQDCNIACACKAVATARPLGQYYTGNAPWAMPLGQCSYDVTTPLRKHPIPSLLVALLASARQIDPDPNAHHTCLKPSGTMLRIASPWCHRAIVPRLWTHQIVFHISGTR